MNFVPLVQTVLHDVLAYFFFLILWVIIFAFFYQVLSVGKESNKKAFLYLSDSWSMSTKGDDGHLTAVYWETDDKDLYYTSLFMTTSIELITVINQVYLKIIMFGFLIAMIKNTYDRNSKQYHQNKYSSRCEMNQVSYNIYKRLPFTSTFETDLVVVSAYFAEPIDIITDNDDIWKKSIED